jgi:hypothetical protein
LPKGRSSHALYVPIEYTSSGLHASVRTRGTPTNPSVAIGRMRCANNRVPGPEEAGSIGKRSEDSQTEGAISVRLHCNRAGREVRPGHRHEDGGRTICGPSTRFAFAPLGLPAPTPRPTTSSSGPWSSAWAHARRRLFGRTISARLSPREPHTARADINKDVRSRVVHLFPLAVRHDVSFALACRARLASRAYTPRCREDEEDWEDYVKVRARGLPGAR